MKVSISERIFILIIIIAASATRLYNLFQIPFTTDEFSLLIRTLFTNVENLINYGIFLKKESSILQSLLYYYIKFVGLNEGWIKLPFIVFGVISVFLVWRLGRELFSHTTGMLAATTLAFLQYPILFSQVAGPFSTGMCFALLMLLGWSRIVLLKSNNFFYNSAIFVVGAILCAYNHYFTLLFATITAIVGMFFIDKKWLFKYILACVVAIILFIPHSLITINSFKCFLQSNNITQIQSPIFFIEYAKFIMHFSWITAGGLLIIVIFSIIRGIIKKNLFINRASIAILILWILPIIFIYFLFGNLLLLTQFGLLIFSFPLLILFIFSQFKDFGIRIPLRISLVWATLLVFTLVFQRQHYKYFYQSANAEAFKELKAFSQTHSTDSTIVFCCTSQEIADYNAKKYNIDKKIEFVFPKKNASPNELSQYLQDSTYKYLILIKNDEENPWIYAHCQEYFPLTITEKNFNLGTTFVMLRGEKKYNNYLKKDICNFDSKSSKHWSFDTSLVSFQVADSSYILSVDSSIKNVIAWNGNAIDLINSRANVFDATVWVCILDSICNAELVVELISNYKIVFNYTMPINKMFCTLDNWSQICASIEFSKLKNIPKNSYLSVRVKNNGNGHFLVKNVFIGIRNGNPYKYWITRDKIALY